jgi:hypothetical protein
MKTEMIGSWMHLRLRAGMIGLLVIAICYLALTGISDLPRAWAFMLLLAISLVLILKSVVDLLVRAFSVSARFSGAGLGYSVRFVRRIF